MHLMQPDVVKGCRSTGLRKIKFQLHLALLEIQRFHNSLTRARSNLWPGMHPVQPPQSASHARKGVQKRTTDRGRELAGAATGCALRAAYAGLRTAPNPLRLPLARGRAQMRLSHCPLKSVRCDQWRFALTVHPSLPSNFRPPATLPWKFVPPILMLGLHDRMCNCPVGEITEFDHGITELVR